MKQKKLSLRDWIHQVGVQELSKTLGVNESCVRHWSVGRVLPRSEQMHRIMELSKGAVTPTIMVRDHFKKTNKMRFYRQ